MSNKTKTLSMKMVASKNKQKVKACSTPEHQVESPTRDSDSLCGSESASPVPFFCTQDGVEGDTDVVWNYYTPKADHKSQQPLKNSTPLSRKTKKYTRPRLIEKQLPKRRTLRVSHKRTELLQELFELNQKLPELLAKNIQQASVPASEDDIFKDSQECSPKSFSRCLRKNVLSSKFSKSDTETALESDDSMNECLLKASQIVEEKLNNSDPTSPKRVCTENSIHVRNSVNNVKSNIIDLKMEQDSMDAILSSIKLESPVVGKTRMYESPKLVNDSFDSFVGNLNDSALEQLTQMPIKNDMSRKAKLKFKESSDWILKEMVVYDSSPSSKTLFSRHSSMPVSPVVDIKPSTSGTTFGRYNSMPHDQNADIAAIGDSPIRCTQDEINRKHQQAREKLLAKRQLPFTSSQQSTKSLLDTIKKKNNTKFQPKVPSSIITTAQKTVPDSTVTENNLKDHSTDIKLLIEKKRREALLKLRRRLPK